MPYIDAVIFTKWVKGTDGTNVPNAITDIYAWAIANGENLPLEPTCFGRWEDLTGQDNVHQRILDNLAVSISKLEITVATAAKFASDTRIWTLGYRRLDDEGEVVFSNWDTPLTTQERQQAANYITANSNISAQQLANAFDASDTRMEIARKLKAFFRE